jgi:hypothetical protein
MEFSELRPQLAALIDSLRAFGDQDMADLLRAYSLAKSHECSCAGDPDDIREAADTIRDEAERVASKLDDAASAFFMAMHADNGRAVWA